MPLSLVNQYFISDVGKASKAFLAIEGLIVQLDTLWNGSPDLDTSITQDDIDETPQFAGITKQQIADTIYVLKQARDAFVANLPSAVMLSRVP